MVPYTEGMWITRLIGIGIFPYLDTDIANLHLGFSVDLLHITQIVV